MTGKKKETIQILKVLSERIQSEDCCEGTASSSYSDLRRESSTTESESGERRSGLTSSQAARQGKQAKLGGERQATTSNPQEVEKQDTK